MANFLALQQEVEAYGFSAAAYALRISTWLNEGQRQIARILNLPTQEANQTLALVANQNAYSLPTTFQRLLYVVDDTNDHVLEVIPEREYESLDHTQRGTPRYAFIQNGVNIVLYPAPDVTTTVIRVHYIGLPTAMSANTDLSGLNADYDFVLKAFALAEAYAAEDDAQMSQFWSAKFRERLISMGEDLNELDYSGPNQVSGAWDF